MWHSSTRLLMRSTRESQQSPDIANAATHCNKFFVAVCCSIRYVSTRKGDCRCSVLRCVHDSLLAILCCSVLQHSLCQHSWVTTVSWHCECCNTLQQRIATPIIFTQQLLMRSTRESQQSPDIANAVASGHAWTWESRQSTRESCVPKL